MKKMIAVVVSVMALFVMSGIGQAAESWPGPKPMLIYKLASGDDRCAIYALGKGSIEVDCAKKTGETFQAAPASKCMATGVKQVCSSTVEFYSFERAATKCGKVCGGSGWALYR